MAKRVDAEEDGPRRSQKWMKVHADQEYVLQIDGNRFQIDNKVCLISIMDSTDSFILTGHCLLMLRKIPPPHLLYGIAPVGEPSPPSGTSWRHPCLLLTFFLHHLIHFPTCSFVASRLQSPCSKVPKSKGRRMDSCAG